MAKTQSKQLAVVTEDPRARMKEIRRQVRNLVRCDYRVDQHNFRPEDNYRVIIALQDLLRTERVKHAKARGHIMDRNDRIQGLSGLLNVICQDSTERLDSNSETIIVMRRKISQLEEQNARLSAAFDQTAHDLETLRHERDAALVTVRTLMGDFE